MYLICTSTPSCLNTFQLIRVNEWALGHVDIEIHDNSLNTSD